MRKLFSNASISMFALLIVLLVLCSVNPSAGSSVSNNSVLRADGWPMPPFPPRNAETLLADGWPMPPFPPQNAGTLLADGWPMPPFPPKLSQTLVVA